MTTVRINPGKTKRYAVEKKFKGHWLSVGEHDEHDKAVDHARAIADDHRWRASNRD